MVLLEYSWSGALGIGMGAVRGFFWRGSGILIAKYHPLALSGSLYPDILGIVIAKYYDLVLAGSLYPENSGNNHS